MIGAPPNPMKALVKAFRNTSPGPGATRRPSVAARARLLPAAVLALAWSSVAGAQVAATRDYLARMDTDGNGRVSLAEYQAWMGYAFAQMDRNRDDRLTADELPGGRGREVSLAEHRQRLAEAFRRQDSNRDGVLDARELAAPPQ
ncbi:EF hand domain-containing protein [Lysobacter ruishenii]|uniref:EF hand domain-containing protein n=1 Tax=Aerolutibacter ruishenii TaxID=686800 RepID=A0A562M082_9GAMM|nr:EF hand domain-containing protein [Lysobacter ruishenii]